MVLPAIQHTEDTLTGSEAEALIALVEADGSLFQATRSRGISAAELLALIGRPAAQEALESLRAFAAIRRELRAEAIRDELVAILRDVARATPDHAEKRRAASTALRACGAGFKPAYARGRLTPSAGGRVPSLAHGGSVIGARSPSMPFEARRGGTRGAPSFTPATPSPHSVIHRAHEPVPPMTGAAPLSSQIHGPSAPGTGPQGAHTSDSNVGAPPAAHASRGTQRVSDLVASLLAAEEAHERAEDARLDRELDEELDEELDAELDADPEGTLAIAHQVLQAVEVDPHAYPPEAIDAARVYIRLAGTTDHPPRPP